MKTFNTKLGTELPLLDLRGKVYLQVAHRIQWFREEKPDWLIKVEFIRLEDDYCIAKAQIFDAEDKLRSVAHKREDKKDFTDFLEKAETSSIGRALAMLGYGTQFTGDELNEGSRIVDSPMVRPTKSINQMHDEIPPPNDSDFPGYASNSSQDDTSTALSHQGDPTTSDLGMFVCQAAKKFLGMQLMDVPTNDLVNYLNHWRKIDAEKPVTGKLLRELQTIEAYIKQGSQQ